MENQELQKLISFQQTNKGFKFTEECIRNSDSYALSILAYSEKADDEAMLMNKTKHDEFNVSINIDSEKFLNAYENLNENEKLSREDIHDNPILGHSKMHDGFMCCFVECNYEQIMRNLKSYNNIEDNYVNIAKLVFTTRGRVYGRFNGI
jgi:hypothetical protein